MELDKELLAITVVAEELVKVDDLPAALKGLGELFASTALWHQKRGKEFTDAQREILEGIEAAALDHVTPLATDSHGKSMTAAINYALAGVLLHGVADSAGNGARTLDISHLERMMEWPPLPQHVPASSKLALQMVESRNLRQCVLGLMKEVLRTVPALHPQFGARDPPTDAELRSWSQCTGSSLTGVDVALQELFDTHFAMQVHDQQQQRNLQIYGEVKVLMEQCLAQDFAGVSEALVEKASFLAMFSICYFLVERVSCGRGVSYVWIAYFFLLRCWPGSRQMTW